MLKPLLFAVCVCAFVCFVANAAFRVVGSVDTSARLTERRDIQREAIDHGHAHYDPRDGSFTWNAPDECGQQERQAADE